MLGSWVRIPFKAWMSVSVYCVCVVLCRGSGLATGWSPVQSPTGQDQGSTKDCRAIDGFCKYTQPLLVNGLVHPIVYFLTGTARIADIYGCELSRFLRIMSPHCSQILEPGLSSLWVEHFSLQGRIWQKGGDKSIILSFTTPHFTGN
jgi:hypothetical protein